jgi:hypothetical protein
MEKIHSIKWGICEKKLVPTWYWNLIETHEESGALYVSPLWAGNLGVDKGDPDERDAGTGLGDPIG